MSALQLLDTYKLYPKFTEEETEVLRCNDLTESVSYPGLSKENV